MASPQALVAWEGRNPSWSIVGNSAVDGTLAVGETRNALWGKKKRPCEILALAGNHTLNYSHSN